MSNSEPNQFENQPNTVPPILVLNETELRASVGITMDALDVVETGFAQLARGEAAVPPIMIVDVEDHDGEVDVKSAYVRGLDSFAVKIASGFFNNPKKGLPSGSGLMILVSSLTGFPQALLLDNGFLTHLRTGLAGAIAAKHLARENVDVLGIIGGGMQGRYQAKAMQLVREFRLVMVYDADGTTTARYVADMSAELGVDVTAASSPAEVVQNSDVVVTTTPAREPYLKAEWLHPGLHVTAMGSDSPEKQELFPDVLGKADLVVCDRLSQCLTHGELHYAVDAGLLNGKKDVYELGSVSIGEHPGRTGDEEITVCDLTGVGVQDTAIALLAFENATAKGLGLKIES